jgi:endoglucanase
MKWFFFFLPCIPIVASWYIRGINFFGYETERGDLMCTWEHNYDWHLKKIQDLGFNTIRLPFSYTYVINGNWKGMDDFFYAVHNYNLSVVLDFHRISNTHQAATPVDDGINFQQFQDAWITILDRYKDNPHLIAVDIFNEYQSDNYHEWNGMAKDIIIHIESHFPNRFWYMLGCVNWGGNCHFVNITTPFDERIFYTIHQYCFSNTEPLEQHWDWNFGGHPIIVGEFGYISSNSDQTKWFQRFIGYLMRTHIYNSFFWTWSYNSGDTGGILKEDCTTIDQDKMGLLTYYWQVGRGLYDVPPLPDVPMPHIPYYPPLPPLPPPPHRHLRI